MRVLKISFAIAILVIVALAAAGIVYVQNNVNDASITIDKKELKEKTHEAIEKTREAGSEGLERMGQALHKAGENVKNSDGQSAPDASAPAPSDESRQSDKDRPPEKVKRESTPDKSSPPADEEKNADR